MIAKLSSPIYLRYEPKSANGKPIVYEVTTVDGLDEVARVVNQQTGQVHFIDQQEFLHCEDAERITDDCTGIVGAVYAPDSVFYVFVG
ncbi:hypothetical protein [Alicyclobacillus ferrooxydans]|uniref:Uncharacterized protein n=1 Tax=Alicyclobacillus ferrooxydans TaxID=471514 RepID=A0A0P9CRP0_9BACL|nr:hypothetical protein [Alicyclobacillus ferrooxydans]KPV45495.1 hypothetical protein AN477_00595 [Alicyclobacillus ferrooxydans]